MKLSNRVLTRVGTRGAQRALGWATLASLAVTVVMGLLVVPPDATQGDVQRLMYVHVPAAWLAFMSFGTVFVASIAYLRTGRIQWDRIAVASAEIGVQFCALTLVLGSLWGQPVWGTWWTWDPRLTTTAVLLLIYVGYLALRRVADSPTRRARWSAVIGIVGFLDVPIVHMSVVWWRSLHQEATVLRPGAPTIAGSMLATLLLAVLAFSLAYAYLMVVRLRVGRAEDRAAGTVLSTPTPRAQTPARVSAVTVTRSSRHA
ncbi:MAG: cytochrome c biogenesis protein CcsA [Nonomuraea sp.]|nr:cytochrome c biogenesis protein CcsA [Dermatophilaceae bacterium]NUR16677.1 cytochrome c biogenesis protein CcsA [Dermatophilaceae bacterium]NUS01703.1 cytochrome c biogenesis protein CcsA [Nonomuraea sp.]